ncbi:hypothetical protein ACRALDRAFT_206893 [Sodiomyces alcalophilus JCM 7366]|uniref:uncharacterized protein n=1 Tax=Sodiomyces alcalophilus JCM 7366 TaxID=591952 RepID=UPI0039B6DF3A
MLISEEGGPPSGTGSLSFSWAGLKVETKLARSEKPPYVSCHHWPGKEKSCHLPSNLRLAFTPSLPTYTRSCATLAVYPETRIVDPSITTIDRDVTAAGIIERAPSSHNFCARARSLKRQ